jgi:hypothetical protein
MVISGELDPTSASVKDWLTYREHLGTLPTKDEGVSVALAIANTQIRKLQNTESGIVAGRRNTA